MLLHVFMQFLCIRKIHKIFTVLTKTYIANCISCMCMDVHVCTHVYAYLSVCTLHVCVIISVHTTNEQFNYESSHNMVCFGCRTSETDQLLVHLQSFAMSPVCYLVPESVKKGVPLFFLLANSTTPQLNVQLSSK